MALHRFEAAKLVATPWKNGGGFTREIVCQPPGAGMDAFDWRVSIAHIASDGPFSTFAGVDRVITLLEGGGMALCSADGAFAERLDRPLVPFAFPGETPVQASLIAGDCQDFNVMTRRDACRARVQVVRENGVLPSTRQGLLMAVQGRWEVSHADGNTQRLSALQGVWWDALPGQWQLHTPDGDGSLIAVLIDGATS